MTSRLRYALEGYSAKFLSGSAPHIHPLLASIKAEAGCLAVVAFWGKRVKYGSTNGDLESALGQSQSVGPKTA